MTCSQCGTEMEDGARFCGGCGSQVEAPVIPQAAVRPFGKTIFQGSGGVLAPGLKRKDAPEALLATLAAPAMKITAPERPQARAASVARPVAAPLPAPAQPAPAPLSPADLDGAILNGRYQVKERIGEGGFGTVYRGEQLQMGRECALKVLHPKMARDPQVVGRFRREAHAASVLKNAHTVSIYDFDQTPEGILYLAMELLHGRSLHADMQEGAMPVAQVVRILDGIADSLGEAHLQGIVHRDIKPENVFLETRGSDRDYVKVLDFGIAKIVSGGGEGGSGVRAPALTAAGQTLGTLEYMSPEQLMGLALDGRSDLYAIGILAYEMLTGDLPFVCKTSGEMITHHLKTVPAAPSKTSPEQSIPPLLDAVVLRMLEKDREKRYRDTGELQADLRRLTTLLQAGGPELMATLPTGGGPPHPSMPAPRAPQVTTQPESPGGGMSAGMKFVVVGLVLAFLGILAAIGLLLRDAGAAEGPPVPARLVPATMSAVASVDLAALRSQSPAMAVAALEEAIRPKLAEIGADLKKVGKVAFGLGPVDKEKPAALLVVDAVLDRGKLEASLKAQLKSNEKFAAATYKGQKYRRSASGEWVILPGDRLIVTNGSGIGPALDLEHGTGAPLVDGAAAGLLGRVGASGGRGPAAFGWASVNDEMRRDLSRAVPEAATLQEMAGSMAVTPEGADLKAVGRCLKDEEAVKGAAAVRLAIERAKRDQTVTLLGLSPILAAVKVDSDGPMVQLGLHLSAAQYGDLFTRLAGVVAAAAERAPPAEPPPVPSPKKKAPQKK
ncbi:MAG: hypothetical protein EXR72_09150 [Myxococcales bacterium]|nr:hypothetical protein [Myxococcales bacterium]